MSFNLAMNETAMLRSSSFYSDARFRHPPVQDALVMFRKTGITVSKCEICHQQSMAHIDPVPGMQFVRYECMVCHTKSPSPKYSAQAAMQYTRLKQGTATSGARTAASQRAGMTYSTLLP